MCRPCSNELPYVVTACQRCALPIPFPGTCGRCQQHTPGFDRAYAIFNYAPPVDFLIQRLKFNRKLNNARLLGSLMAVALSKYYTMAAGGLPEAIIPVPLYPSRVHSRGYNQALELARPIARHFNIPIDYQSCVRTRETAMQSDLPAKMRRDNVKGAFQFRGKCMEHVAIIDDVMTTGHTVNELACVVRKAGVKRVDVWTCARASPGA